jgi:ribosome-associated toxin RatA of RatAB toxin-antitoxin module
VPDESTQSITIDADPATIMSVIADFQHYPAWAESVKHAQVVTTGPDGRAREVDFSLDAGIVQDQYRLRYVWTGNTRVEWELVHGEVLRHQRGSYSLRPGPGGGTEVTYSLAVELAMPMLGQLRRKAERVVMDTALRELKRRVESLA